jgi:hypothetical protein
MKLTDLLTKPGLGLLIGGLLLSFLAAGYAVAFEMLFERPDGQTDSFAVPCGLFVFGLVLAGAGLIQLIGSRKKR